MRFSIGRIKDKLSKAIDRFMGKEEAPEEIVQEEPPFSILDEALNVLKELSAGAAPRPSASRESREMTRRICAEFRKSVPAEITATRVTMKTRQALIISSAVIAVLMGLLNLIGLPYLSILLPIPFITGALKELRNKPSWLRRFSLAAEAASVHAVVNPRGEAEKTVIISSHHDCAERIEGKPLILRSPLMLFSSFAAQGVIALVILVFDLLHGKLFAANTEPIALAVLTIICMIPSLSAYFILKAFTGEYEDSSLAGPAAAVALSRYFAKERPENTRIIAVSFDGTAIGGQGSLEWYKQHRELLVNPICINIDEIGDRLVFLSNDGNGLTSLSEPLFENCLRLADSLGYETEIKRIGFLGGTTDAASAAAFSVPSVSIRGEGGFTEGGMDRVLTLIRRLVSITDSREAEEGLAAEGRKNKISKY